MSAPLRRRPTAGTGRHERHEGDDVILLPAISTGQPTLDTVHHTDALTLLRALPDASVDMAITDPPYGCGSQVSARRSPDKRFIEIAGVEAIDDTWLPPLYRVLKDGGALYLFAKWVNLGDWIGRIKAVGFTVRNCVVWDKMQHGTGDLAGAYAPQHEMIIFATKGRHILRGARTPDVIRIPKVAPNEIVHPYEKPVELLRRFILASSDPGAIVLDPFCGSGATCTAAALTKRHYIAGDVAVEWVTVARNRRNVSRYASPTQIPMFDAAPARVEAQPVALF